MTSFSGGPGFLAFVSTFALVAAVILLFLSLSKQLRKVRTRPPKDEAKTTEAQPAAVEGDVALNDVEASAGSTSTSDVEDDEGDGDVVAEETRDR
ncbi:hypothetical protein [Demequina sediminicola]|uniref:hypothetical protein n=1 Tax=Demequina sediminicola TaxID=1095026 RepID=UPI00128CFB89|nr:hypothetical protein [Demequina sediminicola]